jgi:hypothetical protein
VWSKENTHYKEELRNASPHVTIWVALSANHVFGPFLLWWTSEQPKLLENLTGEWFVSQLVYLNILHMWFHRTVCPLLTCSVGSRPTWMRRSLTDCLGLSTTRANGSLQEAYILTMRRSIMGAYKIECVQPPGQIDRKAKGSCININLAVIPTKWHQTCRCIILLVIYFTTLSFDDMTISEWWKMRKDLVGRGIIYAGIRLKGLRKTMKTFNQHSRSPERRLKPRT